jgi:hypothetical protein
MVSAFTTCIVILYKISKDTLLPEITKKTSTSVTECYVNELSLVRFDTIPGTVVESD